MSERQQIVELHQSGWKICDISKLGIHPLLPSIICPFRYLCVTHSCVSKILQRQDKVLLKSWLLFADIGPLARYDQRMPKRGDKNLHWWLPSGIIACVLALSGNRRSESNWFGMAFVGKRMHPHDLPSTSGFWEDNALLWVFSAFYEQNWTSWTFSSRRKGRQMNEKLGSYRIFLWIEGNWSSDQQNSHLSLEIISLFVSNINFRFVCLLSFLIPS